MNKLRIALLVYCAMALCLLGYFAGAAMLSSSRIGKSIDAVRAKLEPAGQEAKRTERELSDLEIEQKEHRLEYSGPEAVDMSLAVQHALEANDAATSARNALRKEEESLQAEQKVHQLRLVPFIALLLLHGLGLVYFVRPPHQSIMPR